MAQVSGVNGALTIAGTGTIHFRSWTINHTQDAIDTTAFTEATRTKVAGIKDWNLSAEGTLDSATAPILPTAASAVVATVASGETWTGNVIVTGLTPSVDIGGEATISVTAEGTGTLAIN